MDLVTSETVMKLLIFILLALSALSTGWHRVLGAYHPTARAHLDIECFGAKGYMAAFYARRDGPDDVPTALLFPQNSILCVSCDGGELLFLEWNFSGHSLALLKIGGGRHA